MYKILYLPNAFEVLAPSGGKVLVVKTVQEAEYEIYKIVTVYQKNVIFPHTKVIKEHFAIVEV